MSDQRIAVLVPCLNEGHTVGDVVAGFQASLPSSTIYVYDNGSTDSTIERALEAGAVVRVETSPGKGSVVRRMFSDVEADIYVMADGDGTYDPADAPRLLKQLRSENLDMVVGSRRNSGDFGRTGHEFGNQMFNRLYRWLFGAGFTDIFSGYRVFSQRFVRSFPAVSTGFEIETEMSVHASQLRLPVDEIEVGYRARHEGSESKLRTVADGWRILRTMVILLKDNRPFALFGSLAAVSFAAAVGLGVPLLVSFAQTGLVERLPTAVLATGLVLVGLVEVTLGLVLESLTRSRIEVKRLAYLKSP